ncbi:MAG: 50S ribosomal protein L34e [Candidatus Woesearchaeota archaeon]
MPTGRQKSRTLRRVFRRAPKGISRLFYRPKKPSKAKCASCGTELSGTARERPKKMKNLTKSHKRPQRPYGGVLCSKCTRAKLIKGSRQEFQINKSREDPKQ